MITVKEFWESYATEVLDGKFSQNEKEAFYAGAGSMLVLLETHPELVPSLMSELDEFVDEVDKL